MKTFRASLFACAAISAGTLLTSEAQAAVDQYSVDGQTEVAINLVVCSIESQLAVRGNTETDLDFFISDASGNQVHSDEGLDDYISIVLEKEEEGCEPFYLRVVNIGEESNDFTVLLEPVSASTVRVQKYIIQPNETRTVNFKACGTSAKVTARGDGDTDLDFVIRNSDEAVVHEDDDLTDETSAELLGLLGDCETFEMDIANLGEVYNAVMVVIEPEGVTTPDFAGTAPSTALSEGPMWAESDVYSRPASLADGSGPGTYRADANASIRVNVPVCGLTRLEVRGDGDTDLDFTLTNEGGEQVHNDVDLSDVTFVSLEPKDECETYDLRVDNLGEVFNEFTIALVDPATRLETSGAGEYRVNATLATKVPLRICDKTSISARGDGDTDLDFEVVDAAGSIVHENYDMTDATQFTLDPGESCTDYELVASNLGEVYNLLTVSFDDSGVEFVPFRGQGDVPARTVVSPPPPPRPGGGPARPTSGLSTPPPVIQGFAPDALSGDGNSRALALLNRTGEDIQRVYWSNSATLTWGENRLVDDQIFAHDQQWDVNFFDGSNACLFNLRAVTASNRLIEYTWVNICSGSLVVFE